MARCWRRLIRFPRSCAAFALNAIFAGGLTLFFAGCNQSDDIPEEVFDKSYPITPSTSLSVANKDGTIRIYGGGPPVVKIHAVKRAYTQARLHGIGIDVSTQPDAVVVETKFPLRKGWWFADRSGTVDYIIVVPDGMNISRTELQAGEILVDGMRGQTTHAQLGSGRLFIHDCFGNVDLSVASGNFTLIFDWWESKTFSVNASMQDGNGFAYIPTESSFHLIAKTDNGKIGNDFAEQEDRRGDVVTKVDMLVGTNNNVTINLHAADGNLRIVEANP